MSYARDDEPGSGFSSGCAIAAAFFLLLALVGVFGYLFMPIAPRGPAPLIMPTPFPEAGSTVILDDPDIGSEQ